MVARLGAREHSFVWSDLCSWVAGRCARLGKFHFIFFILFTSLRSLPGSVCDYVFESALLLSCWDGDEINDGTQTDRQTDVVRRVRTSVLRSSPCWALLHLFPIHDTYTICQWWARSCWPRVDALYIHMHTCIYVLFLWMFFLCYSSRCFCVWVICSARYRS